MYSHQREMCNEAEWGTGILLKQKQRVQPQYCPVGWLQAPHVKQFAVRNKLLKNVVLFQNPSAMPAPSAQAKGQITVLYCDERSSRIDGNVYQMLECRWWGGGSKCGWNIKGLGLYRFSCSLGQSMFWHTHWGLCYADHTRTALTQALKHGVWKKDL